MAKRLLHNISSAYIEAANRLRPKRAPRRIVAYVESFDDVAFWRQVLDEFESPAVTFEVCLPSHDSLGKGKRQALLNLLSARQLGQTMIACVDADYDYLLSDATELSRLVRHSPYVIHTYVYAIENYQCYAPSLRRAVVTATLNDRPTLDYEEFMRQYSVIVWPLLVWSIWCYRNDAYHDFKLTDLAAIVSAKGISAGKPEEALAAMRRRVNQKVAWLQHRFPEAKRSWGSVRQSLLDLGVTPETTYLYIHGHTLFDNVVVPLLEGICTTLRKEREREITRLAMHDKQRQCELSSYQHSVMPIETVLKKATAFRDAPPFARVRQDISRLLLSAAAAGEPDATKP